MKIKTIEKLKLVLEEAKKLNSSIADSKDIRYKISHSLLNKLIVLTENMISDDGELVRDISSLRYTLEALINIKLCKQDEKYLIIMYYSFIKKQIELTIKVIKRLKNEIKLYKELAEKEKKFQNALLNNINIINNPLEITKKMKDIANSTDDELHSKITIFSEDIETNGYSFHAWGIEKKILSEYEKRLEYLRNEKNKYANNLLTMSLFKKYFPNIKNTEDVFKNLKYTIEINGKEKYMSWKEKAKKVSLNEEYDYIYDYASALIHCDSYSFMTDSNFENDERFLIIKMQYQYLKKIIENIESL